MPISLPTRNVTVEVRVIRRVFACIRHPSTTLPLQCIWRTSMLQSFWVHSRYELKLFVSLAATKARGRSLQEDQHFRRRFAIAGEYVRWMDVDIRHGICVQRQGRTRSHHQILPRRYPRTKSPLELPQGRGTSGLISTGMRTDLSKIPCRRSGSLFTSSTTRDHRLLCTNQQKSGGYGKQAHLSTNLDLP